METTNTERLARGVETLTEMIDRVDVFAFEFPDKDAAGEVYERGLARVGEVMAARADEEDTSFGATIWRACNRAGDRWFVHVVDDGLGLRDTHELWPGGVPYEFEPGLREALVERHLAKIVNSPGKGRRRTDAHYPLGAELSRGGLLSPRIGRDQ
jgi:hypothetical protein